MGWIVFIPLAVWNVLLLASEDPASFTSPVGYLRLVLFALLAAGAVVGACWHAVALARSPQR